MKIALESRSRSEKAGEARRVAPPHSIRLVAKPAFWDALTSTRRLKTLPRKTASFIVYVNCAFRDSGNDADIARVNAQPIKT